MIQFYTMQKQNQITLFPGKEYILANKHYAKGKVKANIRKSGSL